ncbi:MAG: membrane protein insertase YidC [Chitinophagales bacterium]|jgi:YidC/Oxa1 family membrane protein insertase|nr:membrane protein insertase YidC [Sphingobacteriales bacterium]
MFKNFDKNTILGALLIMTMVVVYFKYSTSEAEKRIKDEKLKAVLKAKDSPKNTESIANSTVKAIGVTDTNSSAAIVPIVGEDITLFNELISLKVNTAGGKIHSASLAKHTTYEEKPVELLSNKNTEFELAITSAIGTVNTNTTGFQIVSKDKQKIELQSSQGLRVIYELKPNSYKLSQKWILSGGKENKASLLIKTQMNKQEVNLDRERSLSTIKYLPENEDVLQSLSMTSNETKDVPTPIQWVSFGQQFFHTTIIPSVPFENTILDAKYQEADKNYVKNYTLKTKLADIGDTLSFDYFIGPIDYKLLKKEDKDLDLLVPLSQDILIFRWMKIFNIYLIIPIFNFLSQFVSNYGVIIILLTLFIKLITAPLSYKTYESGVAMRILKPELDKLKAKFGDDQAKLSQEQMKLYGEFGVSPFGGCLPMLLQMPILFAMFSFFPSSIELRHESFLWASDLSTYDSILKLPFNIPFYGAHISLFAMLSALTQIGMSWYSQRLQPSSPQADQMKMLMYVMPVMFLFMFNSFPAALTFYYFLQNILGMLQQWFFTTFIIKEDKIRAKMELAKKTPKKQSAFQKKMADMMEEAEKQKKLQQNLKKK